MESLERESKDRAKETRDVERQPTRMIDGAMAYCKMVGGRLQCKIGRHEYREDLKAEGTEKGRKKSIADAKKSSTSNAPVRSALKKD